VCLCCGVVGLWVVFVCCVMWLLCDICMRYKQKWDNGRLVRIYASLILAQGASVESCAYPVLPTSGDSAGLSSKSSGTTCVGRGLRLVCTVGNGPSSSSAWLRDCSRTLCRIYDPSKSTTISARKPTRMYLNRLPLSMEESPGAFSQSGGIAK